MILNGLFRYFSCRSFNHRWFSHRWFGYSWQLFFAVSGLLSYRFSHRWFSYSWRGYFSLLCLGGYFCSGVLCFSPVLGANVIRFPEKELAKEYVFPVFKNPRAVLNRNVTLTNRFEIRLAGVLRTDEPFFYPASAGGTLAFYWNEAHGLGISGLFFPPGLSKRGQDMRTGIKRTDGQVVSQFDVSLAPAPFFAGFLSYQFSPLYGKISLTKTTVFNFALYTFLGLGTIALKHGPGPLHVVPATHFGVGQKIYFGSYFAIDGGIDFLVYRGPDPVSSKLRWKPNEARPARPPYSDFEKDIFLRFLARVGVVFLI